MLPNADDRTSEGKLGTLSDADISSRRVTRRSLLTTLGIGAGLAAAVVAGVGASRSAVAQTLYLKVEDVDGDVTNSKKRGKKRLRANPQGGTPKGSTGARRRK